jgi:hypothetical protein
MVNPLKNQVVSSITGSGSGSGGGGGGGVKFPVLGS